MYQIKCGLKTLANWQPDISILNTLNLCVCVCVFFYFLFFLFTDRLKVLRHHPDKRKAQGEEIRPDDDYFTCITKAWEILGNPRNRRSFDSVDKEFDDSIPTISEHTRSHFYEVVTL